MALEPGALDFADNFINPDCMAKYMEDEMPKSADPDDSGKRGRRLFLIAISAGIIKYLKDHDDDSFAVHVKVDSVMHDGTLEVF
jgi:hypothetical protein